MRAPHNTAYGAMNDQSEHFVNSNVTIPNVVPMKSMASSERTTKKK